MVNSALNIFVNGLHGEPLEGKTQPKQELPKAMDAAPFKKTNVHEE